VLRLRGRSKKATRGRVRTPKAVAKRISVSNRSADQRSRDGSEERHFPNDLARANQAEGGEDAEVSLEFAFRKNLGFLRCQAVSVDRRASVVSLTLRDSCTASGAGLSSVPGAWESDFPCSVWPTDRFCNEAGAFG
jgi:hypothetical protein